MSSALINIVIITLNNCYKLPEPVTTKQNEKNSLVESFSFLGIILMLLVCFWVKSEKKINILSSLSFKRISETNLLSSFYLIFSYGEIIICFLLICLLRSLEVIQRFHWIHKASEKFKEGVMIIFDTCLIFLFFQKVIAASIASYHTTRIKRIFFEEFSDFNRFNTFELT